MSTKRIKIWIFTALIPIFILGIFFLISDTPIIKIGNEKITEKMLSYQIGVQQAYGASDVKKLMATVELMRFMLEKKVAKNNGVKITKKEIADFSEYADKNTKAPEILEKVKAVFGDDRASYEKIYLIPKINNQKITAFYSRNAEIHKEERQKIEYAYSLVTAGQDFKKIAEQIGGDYHELEVKEELIESPPELKTLGMEPATNPLLPIIKTLSFGQIYPNIVENDQSFMVIKLLGQNENSYKIAAIIIGKKPFDDWFKKEAEKIEIEILDGDLKNSVCAEYSQVWWLTKVCSQ